jgi:hypothetical protein
MEAKAKEVCEASSVTVVRVDSRSMLMCTVVQTANELGVRLESAAIACGTHRRNAMGRGILLWMLGVPIPIILLLAMCSHH